MENDASTDSNKQVINLGEGYSIAGILLRELRDEKIQKERKRFRENIFRLGQIAAFEISKLLNYQKVKIFTPLGVTDGVELVTQPVIAPILRAGLPLYEGVLSFISNADSAFISAYRKHDNFDGFEINVTSISCPNIDNRTIIICDPMIATGQSLVKTINELMDLGRPFQIIVCSVVCCEQGIEYVHRYYPDVPIYTFAVDPELNAKSYIVPGLGDAGDLSFGPKIQD